MEEPIVLISCLLWMMINVYNCLYYTCMSFTLQYVMVKSQNMVKYVLGVGGRGFFYIKTWYKIITWFT